MSTTTVSILSPAVPLVLRGPIGTTGPPVLALHGLGASGSSWVPVLQRAAHGHRAWAVDLRGHGGSARDPDGYSLDGHVADVAAVLERIGEPTILVGRCLGAVVATALAQQGHPLVSSLFLDGPPELAPDLGRLAVLADQVGHLQATRAPLDRYDALFAGDDATADARTSRSAALQVVDVDCFEAARYGRTTEGFDPDRPRLVPTTLVLPTAGSHGSPAGRARLVATLEDFLTRQRGAQP